MRWFGRIAVTLVVLLGLLLVVDRVGAWYAERQVAEQVSDELAGYQVSSSAPDVSVHGFPFLTQAVAGRYREVRLGLRDVETGGLRVPSLDLTATGVDAPLSTVLGGSGTIRADQVVATATISYDSVAALADLPDLTLYAEGEVLRMRLPVELFGTPFVLVGAATVGMAGEAVQIRVAELTVADPESVPAAEAAPVVDRYTTALAIDVPLPALPYGLVVEEVQVASEGLVVAGRGHDVPLSGDVR